MEEHQERVVKEKTALDEKIVKLNVFVKTEMYNGLDTGERKIMRKQLDAMNLYSNILNERINSFEVKEPAEEQEEEVPGGASVTTEDKSCPDCGSPEGEKHSDGCPTIAEESEEAPPADGEGDDFPAEEPEPSEPEEAPDLTDDDMPEEVDCFGTFDSNDAECANCDRINDCSKETFPPEESSEVVPEDITPEEASELPSGEPEAEEPVVEEGKDEAQEKTPFYTCRKCGKGFEEYKIAKNGDWLCPHKDCKTKDWM